MRRARPEVLRAAALREWATRRVCRSPAAWAALAGHSATVRGLAAAHDAASVPLEPACTASGSAQSRLEAAPDTPTRVRIIAEQLHAAVARSRSATDDDDADDDSIFADAAYARVAAACVPAIVAAAGPERLPPAAVVAALLPCAAAPAVVAALVAAAPALLPAVVRQLLSPDGSSDSSGEAARAAVLCAVAATGPDAAAVVADALLCRVPCGVPVAALLAAARALAPADRADLVLRLAARPDAARALRPALSGSCAEAAAAVREQLLSAALDDTAASAAAAAAAAEHALRALVAWHCSALQQEATAAEVQRVAAHAQRPGTRAATALLCAALLLAAPRAPPDAITALVRRALSSEGNDGGDDGVLAAHALLLCCVAHRSHAPDAGALAPRVAAFLADLCGAPVAVAPRALQHALDAVRRDGPAERTCCERATAAPAPWDAAQQGPLALLAVDTLLAAHAFARAAVPVRAWLAAQVRAAAHPVPPLLVRVLRRYHRDTGAAAPPLLDEAAVRAALGMPPPPPCRTRGIIPVPAADGAPLADDRTPPAPDNGSAAPALVLYCVLLAGEHGARPALPADLLWELPVEAVLAQLRAHDPADTSGLGAALAQLVVSQMPYAAPDLSLVQEQQEEVEEDEEDDNNEDEEDLSTVLEDLETLVLRLPCVDEGACAALARRWHRHYTRAPWATARATARVLCVRANGGVGAPTAADLVADPLTVLCVRTPHIVRTPALVAVLLAVLARVRCASHHALQDAAANAAAAPDEALGVLPRVQDSALVQALLELLLPAHRALPPFASARARRGVAARVCAFVHALFLADPRLIRAVHTQGYDARLVPVLARRVPSLHVCLDWLPDLLAHADAPRARFAVRLAAALVARHRTPRSLAVAEAVLARLRAYAARPAPDASRLLAAALPALAPLCAAFPALAHPAAALVADLRALVAGDPDAADAALAETLSRVHTRLAPLLLLAQQQQQTQQQQTE